MEACLISDPFLDSVAIPALLIVGISKGGFGGGLGIVDSFLVRGCTELVLEAA